MKTQRLGPADVPLAAAILRGGGLVAFPTETVYGLGGDGLDAAAARRIFLAKGRPADNPLILHAADALSARRLTRDWPKAADRLAAAFWPGPLTLVLPRAAVVPDEVAAGLDTVAVRVPAHPLALALLLALGRPVAAPSANRSGRPSPTTAGDVVEDLEGRIEAVLDGGPTGVGVESTVVDLTVRPPRLLRQGGLAQETLEAVAGPLADPSGGEPVRSPGMKYRHYAPRTPLLLAADGQVAALLAAHPEAAALLTDESVLAVGRRAGPVRRLGPRGDAAAQARALFAALRELDRSGAPLIVVESVPEAGLGRAVMDRLRRAAGKR